MKPIEMNLLQNYKIEIEGPALHYLMLMLQEDTKHFKNYGIKKYFDFTKTTYKNILKQIKEQSK